MYTVSSEESYPSSAAADTGGGGGGGGGGGEMVRRGRIDRRLLDEVVPLAKYGESMVFLCGPPAMEKALAGTKGTPGILEQIGYRRDRIYTL